MTWHFSPDGNTLYFTRMSIQRPNEIWNLTLPVQTHWDDLPGGEALTHFNDSILSQIEMFPLQTFGSPALTATESKASSSNLPTSTPAKSIP